MAAVICSLNPLTYQGSPTLLSRKDESGGLIGLATFFARFGKISGNVINVIKIVPRN